MVLRSVIASSSRHKKNPYDWMRIAGGSLVFDDDKHPTKPNVGNGKAGTPNQPENGKSRQMAHSTKKVASATVTTDDRIGYDNLVEWLDRHGMLPPEDEPAAANDRLPDPPPDENQTNTDAFLEFVNLVFGDAADSLINLCTFRNRSGAGPQITSSDSKSSDQIRRQV